MERAKGRRIIQVVSIVAGLVALGWTMRERMISIDTPRDEEPPSFRVNNGAKGD